MYIILLMTMIGEQALWTEQSGPENLDPIVWPRAASSAEVGYAQHSQYETDLQRRSFGLEQRFRMAQPGMLIRHYLVYMNCDIGW